MEDGSPPETYLKKDVILEKITGCRVDIGNGIQGHELGSIQVTYYGFPF